MFRRSKRNSHIEEFEDITVQIERLRVAGRESTTNAAMAIPTPTFFTVIALAEGKPIIQEIAGIMAIGGWAYTTFELVRGLKIADQVTALRKDYIGRYLRPNRT
ncbi:MAG TPA: hypothetical protein VL944_00935 [Candidatus Acidoferrum sp.]|nr:hypothetical protein [Candidatus Acidoferrum sp.]